MAAETTRSLLDRRVVIVTGKGGTGKTTVAAALALAAAERGLNVLVAELGRFEQLPALLADDAPAGAPAPPVGYEGRTLRPGLHVMRLDPFAAIAEYASLQLGSGWWVERVMQARGLRPLLDGAPGWRELVVLGKTWHLEQQRRADGRPRYDLIVLDAPATGHGLGLLDVPRVARSAVRTGPLARSAEKVEALLRDPSRTVVLPVCLAEELPVQETAELVARLRDVLGSSADRVVVNALAPPPPMRDPDALRARLAKLPPDLPLRTLPAPAELARVVEHGASRHRLNVEYADEVERRTGLPTVQLPWLGGGVRGPAALRALGGPLLAEPVRHAARAPADERATVAGRG